MPLPPKFIKVKRKRTDEPVDKLYIEHTKRRTTDQRFVYRRQITEPSASRQTPPAEPSLPPGVPRIRATKPGDELKELERLYRDVSRDKPVEGHQQPPLPSAKASQERRTFRLTKPASSSGGGQKRSRDAEDDVAIVVEQKRRKQLDGLAASAEAPVEDSRSLKRPSARAPRALKRTKDHAPRETDESLQTAMQEMAADYMGLSESGALQSALLNTEPANQDTAMTEPSEEIDDVFDTYARDGTEETPVGSTSMETMSDSSGNLGFLSIDDEDEQLWDTYAEGEDEDELDWDSEQDDENAENWYGADYPEEEVDSDDEFNTDPYKYHGQGDSDEDEYLELGEEWGYGSSFNHSPWKRVEHEGASGEASDGASDAEDL